MHKGVILVSDAERETLEQELEQLEHCSAEAVQYLQYAQKRIKHLRRQLCRHSRRNLRLLR